MYVAMDIRARLKPIQALSTEKILVPHIYIYIYIFIYLFLVPASAQRMVEQRPWQVLSCLWDDAYKRTLAANRKE